MFLRHTWTKKNIRMVLGVIMSAGFVDFAFTVYFLSEVSIRLGTVYMAGIVFFSFNYLYMPCVMLIIVCYLLLTRVWRYDEKH
jgi:hypothetical protein